MEWTQYRVEVLKAKVGYGSARRRMERGLIKEIRAYYASPAGPSALINELVDFDYAGRGYNLTAP
jgi:hypothetical protein